MNRIASSAYRVVRLATCLFLLGGLVMCESPSFVMAGLKLLPDPWNKDANMQKLEDYARRAAAGGADLIVTPEGYLEGYVGNPNILKNRTGEVLDWEKYLAVAEPANGPSLQRTAALARELKKFILLGFAERRGNMVYNSAVLFSPEGKPVAKYAKSHTGGAGEPLNQSGNEFPVFDTALGKLGLLICYDRQMPENSRILAVKGAKVILIPAFGMGTTEINEDIMMRTRAYENGVYVAHVHPRNTFIVNPRGAIIAQSKGTDESIVFARIEPSKFADSSDIWKRRRPEIYQEILKQGTRSQ